MALKVIDIESTEDDLQDIQQEVNFQSQCDDEHITRYFGSYIKGNELWIAMEYLGGGSVADLVLHTFSSSSFLASVSACKPFYFPNSSKQLLSRSTTSGPSFAGW